MLDKRLKLCADMVSGNGIVVDVGTDHGYLPCYLINNCVCKKAIACDINALPLEAAERNVKRQGLGNSIELILSDGLKLVPKDNVSDIVIAGMGGELISKILCEAKWVCDNGINLVLQPMTKVVELRKWLFDNAFEILEEKACLDEFYYTVIRARYCGEVVKYSKEDTYIGGLSDKRDDDVGYLNKQLEKLETAISGMQKSGKKSDEADNLIAVSTKIRDFLNGEGNH